MSCGGAIALTRLGVGYEIRVNWLTGRVEIVPVQRALTDRSEAGFTLIEVLVALAVVAVSLVAIGSVMSTNMRGVKALEQPCRADARRAGRTGDRNSAAQGTRARRAVRAGR